MDINAAHMNATHTASGHVVDGLTLLELRALQQNVEQAIRHEREIARREALVTIAGLIEAGELSADEVIAHLSAKPRRRRKKLPPKYRDPHNPDNTWAGRGKRPNWLTAELARGARLEDFAIAATTVATTVATTAATLVALPEATA